MRYREDYATAGVPMLPVVRGDKTVAVQIILYSWALFISTLILIPAAPMGWVYTVVAVVSGGWFMYESYVLYRQGFKGTVKNPMRLFHGSISYLTVQFIAIAIDPLIYIRL